MNATQVLVQGTLRPDGTLELIETPALPAGPVEVLIRAQPLANGTVETWWQYLQHARAELLAQGHTFREREEIDAERTRPRQGDEARRRALDRLQTPPE